MRILKTVVSLQEYAKKIILSQHILFNQSDNFLHVIFMVQDESIHVEIELRFFMPYHEQSFGNLWLVWLLLFLILTLVSLDI